MTGLRNDEDKRRERGDDNEDLEFLVCHRSRSVPSEQAGRLDREDQNHRRVKREIGDFRKKCLAEIIGETDRQRADRRAAE